MSDATKLIEDLKTLRRDVCARVRYACSCAAESIEPERPQRFFFMAGRLETVRRNPDLLGALIVSRAKCALLPILFESWEDGRQGWDCFIDIARNICLAAVRYSTCEVSRDYLVNCNSELAFIEAGICEEIERLIGAVNQEHPNNAIPKADVAKPSRKKPDSDLTKWVRKNWHKYGHCKAEAVRKYLEIHEIHDKHYVRYYTQLSNDCRKNPLVKPRK